MYISSVFGNIQIQVIFITPIHKVFNLLASSSLLMFPTSCVSSANFTTEFTTNARHHFIVCLGNFKHYQFLSDFILYIYIFGAVPYENVRKMKLFHTDCPD